MVDDDILKSINTESICQNPQLDKKQILGVTLPTMSILVGGVACLLLVVDRQSESLHVQPLENESENFRFNVIQSVGLDLAFDEFAVESFLKDGGVTASKFLVDLKELNF